MDSLEMKNENPTENHELSANNKCCNGKKKDSDYLILNLRCTKIKILKPLVTLKLSLFIWFAAASAVMTFFMVYLKQMGLTIQEIFLMFSVIPVLQTLFTAGAAVIADKFGKAKIILICNLLIAGAAVIVLNFVPLVNLPDCRNISANLYCDSENATCTIDLEPCKTNKTEMSLENCELRCLHTTNNCDGQNCQLQEQSENMSFNKTIYINISSFKNETTFCGFSPNSNSSSNVFPKQCQKSCSLTYLKSNIEECREGTKGRLLTVFIYIVIITIFMTAYVNCYRFFDVTAMILVKELDSDYGLVRFWTILGALAGPLLGGVAIQLAPNSGGEEKYSMTFYLFSVMCILNAIAVWKVDVKISTTGTKLFKKTILFAKSLDVLFFYLLLLVLGTSWGFKSMYKNWFLAEIGTPDYLFSLTDSAPSIFGLPFLYKSKWIVGKLGEVNVFVLSLMAYGIGFIGYSYLQTAWLALLIEVTTVVNYQLLWVAVMNYCIKITPDGIVAIVNSTAGSVHFTVGRITGGSFGGFLMSTYGSSEKMIQNNMDKQGEDEISLNQILKYTVQRMQLLMDDDAKAMEHTLIKLELFTI
ncbi:major facilitator superfamily domain-containing protein 6 [Trichonephila clavata]|uniref:Major facilitator superfamily domain-containing protein 6 n=1 Tax=Trichonephila clavata TaxID=2740835 RepID=A0A8X6HFA7_TRICU|nr:major facilitator superfamily domain-containing protein 6 [Trichonephila clavata]